MVAAGVGGSMEWSLRCIRANSVMGMWQEMHLLAFALRRMVAVGCRVLHPLLMAGQAGVVGLLLLEPVAAAGGVAVDAVELAGLDAGAHAPGGLGVVLPQVAAVGIEVGVLQGHQVEVVEEALPGVGSWRSAGIALAWQESQASLRCAVVMSWCG